MLRSEDIIDSIFDDEAFARLPALLASSLGARSTILHWKHTDGEFEAIGFSHFTPEWMNAYTKVWAQLDPWMMAAQAKKNALILANEVVPDRVFRQSAIYNDFIREYGDDTSFCVGGAYSTPWGEGLVGVHRGVQAKPFENDDLGRLAIYNRAIGQMFKVKGELAQARREGAMAKAALDAIAYGIILVSGDGRIRFCNRAAERVLERGDGLMSSAGVLSTRSGSSVRLLGAIARAVSAPAPVAQTLVIGRPDDQLPYLLTICPTHRGPGAQVIFRDPDAEDPTLVARLRSLFNLSMAEACIASEITKGRSPEDICRRRAVSLNTLKTQVASLMGKMDCRSRAEIVMKVLALPSHA